MFQKQIWKPLYLNLSLHISYTDSRNLVRKETRTNVDMLLETSSLKKTHSTTLFRMSKILILKNFKFVKDFIDQYLNPKQVDLHNPDKPFFSSLTIKKIFLDLNIEESKYYEALSTSPDSVSEIHMER